jgi:hypothetical protein
MIKAKNDIKFDVNSCFNDIFDRYQAIRYTQFHRICKSNL